MGLWECAREPFLRLLIQANINQHQTISSFEWFPIHSNALWEIHISSQVNCTHVIFQRRKHLRMVSRNCPVCSWNRRDETKQHTNHMEYLKKNTRRNECEIKAKASDEMTEIVPASLRGIYIASNSRHFSSQIWVIWWVIRWPFPLVIPIIFFDQQAGQTLLFFFVSNILHILHSVWCSHSNEYFQNRFAEFNETIISRFWNDIRTSCRNSKDINLKKEWTPIPYANCTTRSDRKISY